MPPPEATIYRARPRRLYAALAVLVAAVGATVGGLSVSARSARKPEGAPTPRRTPAVERIRALRPPAAKAINTSFPGITTFLGNATRSHYGRGPVPRRPVILWRYPRKGGMCSRSADEHGVMTWCGVGWTGQPNVVPRTGGGYEIRFGAYDGRYHFLDAETGEPLRPDLVTGDLAKGSATSDPDGYPLYYAGSRDNRLRVVALDRERPTVLWSLDSHDVPRVVWNDDWDGAPLVVGDHLLVGGENSWFYVIRLNRGYDADGKVKVRPRVVVRVPGWDAELLRALGDERVSIEGSVAFRNGVAYFANSGGLVQGWDVSEVLGGGRRSGACSASGRATTPTPRS